MGTVDNSAGHDGGVGLLREPAARRLGLVPSLRFAVAMVALTAGWVLGAFADWWTVPLVGWIGPIVLCVQSAIGCRRVSRHPGLTPAARRMWRSLAHATVLLTGGTISAMYDALGGPGGPTQRLSPLSLGLYVGALLMMMWIMLRLPVGHGRGNWLQFALDSGSVVVTVAVIGWHFSFRDPQRWVAVSGSVWPLLVILTLAFVAVVAIYKVFALGIGSIDSSVLRLLALATILAGAAGSLSPFLVGRPYINDSQLSVPFAGFMLLLTAHRQAFVAERPAHARPERRRRWSVLPYVAIVAMNALLLFHGRGPDGATLIAGAVTLTTLVGLRQILAFRDNARLLGALDDSVTDLRVAQDQLVTQATHDELTGLGNRRLLHERIAEALNGVPPPDVHLALIDLDDFKTVNDRLGHLVGDELLKAVATLLRDIAGARTTIVRLGGDEFAVLLAPASRAEADGAVERIADGLKHPLHVAGSELLMQASIGLADADTTDDSGAPRPGENPEADARELLRRADVAMYAAKDLGKHRVARFTPDMDRDAAEDARLGAQLRRAIEHGELHLVYQPIVELPHGTITGAEALVRWRHPELGPVSPAAFIPAAERSGLIVPLGEWILREVCRQAAEWQRRGHTALRRVSVNVSARQLREPEFPETVAAVLAETGLRPAGLTIEVTETAVFDDGRALDSVRELKDLGLSIALDDFGTGHSSLGLLRTCPVDILKVDKSFVDELGTDGDQTVIAGALIQIADGLRLQAVAEGVETDGQVAELIRLGYRYAQGYHFARPMPAADLTTLLSREEAAALAS
jgi:diguanylate cyclase (GGDEF)-like protein